MANQWCLKHIVLKQHYLLFILLYFYFVCAAFGQSQQKVDSLISVLETKSATEKEKARLLSAIAYNHPIPSQSLIYAKKSLEIAKVLNDAELQAEAWEEIGHVERLLGNNPKSFEAAIKALNIYERLNLKERQAASYVQLGANYVNDEDYTSAILNLSKACDIYKAKDKTTNYAITLVNLGEAYRLYGVLDSAEVQFKKALQINGMLNNDMIFAYASGNLGMVYKANGKYLQAKQQLQTSAELLTLLGDPYSSSVFLAELGNVYVKENQFEIAETKFIEALKLAKGNGLKEQIRNVSEMLAVFYEQRRDFEKALKYKKQFQIYQDSLINKANIQKIEQLKAGYEIGLRETEISKLNTISANRKKITIGLLIGIVFLGLFLYLLSRANKNLKVQKAIITEREKEKALLLNELNHRVKNNLQMVSSLLNLQSHELSGQSAKEALQSGQYRVEALSLVHKKLYQDGLKTKVQLNDYVEELVLGLLYSYGLDFEPELNIEDLSVSVDVAIPISLIINELVTNAIKYAFKDNEQPHLKINMSLKEAYLIIDVIDNGEGFSEDAYRKSNSFGIKLVTSLVEQLQGKITLLNTMGTHWKLDLKWA